MKLSIAYGLPASGKTTLLKSLPAEYIDFDNKFAIRKLLGSLKEGKEYAIDFMCFRPDVFLKTFFDMFPFGQVIIYRFRINRILSLKRDAKRPKERQSTNLIHKMELHPIESHKNLKIIDVDNEGKVININSII